MARVLYLGPPASVRMPPDGSAADLMLAVGRNTGNLFIGDAIRRHLSVASFQTAESLLQQQGEPRTTPRLARLDKLDRAFIESSYDVIVIGAANFLFEQFDFSGWADFLESVRIRCVIIGLGAQAPDYGRPVTVPAGTMRMVKIIAERSRSLGVRGRFTAATLERLGIKNVRVIGCPSMYWTCQPTLSLKPSNVSQRLVVYTNGSASVAEHSFDPDAARRVEAMIARLSFDHGYAYVLQDEVDLMAVVRAGSNLDPATVDHLKARYGLSAIGADVFLEFVRRRMKVFSETGDWLNAVRHADLVLGTRFHGCVVGLLAGVPCMLFVHDARTREMSELLQIPRLDVSSVREIDVGTLYDSLNLEPTQASYAGLYRNYVEFLDENDLEHGLHL
jgi:Polysaccharide pyruvyl transferase